MTTAHGGTMGNRVSHHTVWHPAVWHPAAMSDAWAGGSTRAWRKLRAHVLMRDGHLCQIPDHPETPDQLRAQLRRECTKTATHVHHLDGVDAGLLCPPNRLTSSCESCNLTLGDPTRFFPAWGTRTPAAMSFLSPPSSRTRGEQS